MTVNHATGITRPIPDASSSDAAQIAPVWLELNLAQ